jgi:hypothetical protein
MALTLRRFLILALALLQLLAPLLHAHAGNSMMKGLHLYEFETLSWPADDSAFLSTLQHEIEDAAIVGVGQLIKQSSTLDHLPLFYLHQTLFVWGVTFVRQQVNFSPPDVGILAAPPNNTHLSRAPPAV